MTPRTTFIDARTAIGLVRSGRRVVVLDVRVDDGLPDPLHEYREGHVPGAHPVDLATELAGPERGFSGRRPLPDPVALEESFARWGVDGSAPVIIVSGREYAAAGRAWWVLSWAGVPDVAVLDGGIDAWVEEGGELTTRVPPPVGSGTTVVPGSMPSVDADGAAELATDGVLLDARGGSQFVGDVCIGAARPGHIPGAVNAPGSANLDSRGRLLPKDDLRRRFADLGIDGTRPVGVYCGAGVASAHQTLVLASLGITAALFPGSWSAWAADPRRPAARGAATGGS